jgi:lipoprotein-releasing system ATP-binding protein
MGDVVLEARGLSKGYGEGAARTEVLRGVDLTVRAGELLAILGPSGSGKSTLLNLLGLMDRPSGGEVLVGGRPAAAMPEDDRAALRNKHVGFVFQFDALMPEFTVLENVLMPGRIAGASGEGLKALETRAAELLGVLGIAPLAGRFPAGLSGGERQRAALARALLNSPGTLLADEPTGNLDRPNAELVFSRLKELAGRYGVAVVMVTHNEDAVGYASRTVRLRDGRLAEERP